MRSTGDVLHAGGDYYVITPLRGRRDTRRRPISFGVDSRDEFCEGGRWGRASEMEMTDDRLAALSRFDARLTLRR